MNRDTFIAETSAKILASMFKNQDKDPSAKIAVSFATELWEELQNQGVCPDFPTE